MIWWNIQKIFRKKIKFTPQLFLLGIFVDLNEKETTFMLNLLTAARLLVGLYWKKDSLPTLEEWIFKVSSFAEMAKISAYLKGHTQERYITVWGRWIDYIQKKYGIKKFYLFYE